MNKEVNIDTSVDMNSLQEAADFNHSQTQNAKLIIGAAWGAAVLSILCFLALQFSFFRRDFSEFITMFAIIWAGYGFFILVVLSGLNRKLADPSLSTPVILWSSFTILWAAYYLDQLRLAALMLYLSAMLIGAFRYKLKQFVFSSLLTIGGYFFVLMLLHYQDPEILELGAELIQWGAFSLLTGGYVLMTGEIVHIRDQVQSANDELNTTLSKISELAITDELTGLHNRRYAMQVLKQQKGMADREAYNFAICFFDLDLFKSINDNYGHQVGDLVLKKFSELAQGAVSDIDYCSRFGGEEFVLILVKKNLEAARTIADDIRKLIEEADFEHIEKGLNVTVSVGVSEFIPREEIEHCLSRADEALYEAKDSGRNQVKVGLPTPE